MNIQSKINPEIERRMCSRKSRYDTLGRAEKYIDRQIKDDPELYLRVYFCPICSGFHLTKQKNYKEQHEKAISV